LVNE